MKQSEYNSLMSLVEFWESIADRLDNHPVQMSANTHRLFANELRTILMHMRPQPSLLSRIKGVFK